MTRNRRAAPGRTAVGYFMPFSECRRRQPRGPGAAAEAAAKAEEEEAATELVKVKAQRRFLDKELNQIKDTGDVYTVSRERATVLKEAGVVEVAE